MSIYNWQKYDTIDDHHHKKTSGYTPALPCSSLMALFITRTDMSLFGQDSLAVYAETLFPYVYTLPLIKMWGGKRELLIHILLFHQQQLALFDHILLFHRQQLALFEA